MRVSAPIIRLAWTGSTNDYLAGLWRCDSRAVPPAAFTAVLADGQTRGRGRMERSWLCPRGTSMLLSVLVPCAPEAVTWVPLTAGVAVVDYLRALAAAPGTVGDPRVLLKWPNDVLLDGLKVAGILAEYLGQRDGRAWVALGVGLNLTQTRDQLPASPSTSAALAGLAAPSPLEAALAVRERLHDLLSLPLEQVRGRFDAALGMDHPVSVSIPGGTRVSGWPVGVDKDGALLVRTTVDRSEAEGSLVRVLAGDVELVGKAEPVGARVSPSLTRTGDRQ